MIDLMILSLSIKVFEFKFSSSLPKLSVALNDTENPNQAGGRRSRQEQLGSTLTMTPMES